MNVSILEEWVGKMGLPRGVQSHLAPVRDLLNWLQVRDPYRYSIGLLPRLIVVLVSLYYQRLRKLDRNGTDDAMSESPPSESGCISGCWDILMIGVRCAAPFEITDMR